MDLRLYVFLICGRSSDIDSSCMPRWRLELAAEAFGYSALGDGSVDVEDEKVERLNNFFDECIIALTNVVSPLPVPGLVESP